MPLLPRAARHAHWIALLSAILLFAVVSRRPQGLHFYDQAMQSIALQQWLEGASPSPNVLIRADPADISRDIHEWLSWWPPSLQLLAGPLIHGGFSIGGALRVVFAAGLIFGAMGWLRWARRFQLPPAWLVFLAVCLPWMRHVSENAFRYSAEILSFGAAPWLLLLALRVPRWIHDATGRSLLVLALAGLAFGTAYALKYSLFVFVLATLVCIAWESRAAWGGKTRCISSLASLAMLGICAAAVPLAFRLVNAARGSADPVSFAGAHRFNPMDLIFAVSNPALALADAQGPLFHALVFPGLLLPAGVSQTLGGLNLLAWVAAPAGLLLSFLLWRFWRSTHSGGDLPARMAFCILMLNTLGLLALWQFADVDHVARHIAPAALAVLPLAMREGLNTWHAGPRWLKPMLVLGALGFVAGPLAYGFVYVGAKCRSIPADYRVGKSGLILPNVSRADVPSAIAAARRFASHEVVWMVDDPEMALELPGRFMLIYGDRNIGSEMRRLQRGMWRTRGDLATSRPMTMLVLIQAGGSETADAAHAQRLFETMPKAHDWQRHEIPTATFVLWSGRLDP